ncbi:MAG: hypothetical protein EU541_07885 [Promethearchaeota archaeon]|nr:MAG: hypothetical protein EU541_07885 [Candidatus Lokiarchaeota archaeon]
MISHSSLKKVRYVFRTVLYLKYKEEQRIFSKKIDKINKDDLISYDDKKKMINNLISQEENLNLIKRFYPISCILCGTRMEDLIFLLDFSGYFCDDCSKMLRKSKSENFKSLNSLC